MSSLVADPVELGLDSRRLHDAVREAGEHSTGVDAISVWVMDDEEDGRLFTPSGGWWRSHEMGESGNGVNNAALARLEDSTREDYVPPPRSVGPGSEYEYYVGVKDTGAIAACMYSYLPNNLRFLTSLQYTADIAGILWAESRGGNRTLPRRRSSLDFIFGSGESLKSLDKQPQQDPSAVTSVNYQPIRWRDIRSISEDPDSAKGPRLELMQEAGFAMAAGVTFRYLHHRGMVIFLTTASDSNDGRLTSIASDAYMHQAAQSIGATLSLAELRRASLAERFKLKEKCYSMHECVEKTAAECCHVEAKMEEGAGGKKANPVGGNLDQGRALEDETKKARFLLPPQVTMWLNKMKGGSMQAMPPLSWSQTSWTILGCFVGLLVLLALNEYYRMLSDDEYYLLIAPFGATCTLMYGMSSAPASQPRNAVMGQATAGAVSLAFTYIPESVLPVWLRTAVGPAFAIGTMVKLGVMHPPAGAHSLLYASGKYNFGFYALVVLSTALSVFPATLVNNMSSKRQYPTYWGVKQPFVGLHRFYECCLGFRGSCGEPISSEKNPDSTKTMRSKELSAGQLDASKASENKMRPNRLVIHEGEDEGSLNKGTSNVQSAGSRDDETVDNTSSGISSPARYDTTWLTSSSHFGSVPIAGDLHRRLCFSAAVLCGTWQSREWLHCAGIAPEK